MPLFRRNKSRGQSGSSDVASERLRLVLAHDRANLPPGLLETLKDEIVEVISRHIAVNVEDVQVSFSQDTRESRLVADIPLLVRPTRVKR
ncbi:MAG: cell division topological specificity factor MinE [Anaerolineales bacterium]|nr:cell division topological specificity factor MinE [Anaerolineales bacterium]